MGTFDNKMLEIRGTPDRYSLARGNNVLAEIEYLFFPWSIFTFSGEGEHLLLWPVLAQY